MKILQTSRAAIALSALGLVAIIAACQSSGPVTGPGRPPALRVAAGEAGQMGLWGPGTQPEVGPGGRAGETGRRPGAARPPYAHWRIQGDEVPGWEPAAGTQRAGLAWEPIGPRPILGEFWSGGGDASGRITSIAPSPVDPLICYIASASGGLWKTVDGGLTWEPMSDTVATLNHGLVAVSFSNPDTVIATTGEYTTGSTGAGVFRSDDAGETWVRIGTASQAGSRTSGLAIHPLDPNIVHVTSTLGYRRTTDGGVSWGGAAAGLPVGDCSSLAMDPFNPDTLYVARRGDGIYRSSDAGVNFVKLGGGLPGSGFTRIVMSICQSDPAVLYAAFVNLDDGLLGLYKTADSGSSWELLDATPDFPAPDGNYSCAVTVDPFDADTIYCGGVAPIAAGGGGGLIKSTNGGASWIDITAYPMGLVHRDLQAIAIGPSGTVWVGSAGGVWKSDTFGLGFENCNATLQVTQHYALGLHPGDPNIILGGSQDNGTPEKLDAELSWLQVLPDNGGFSAFDAQDPDRFYATKDSLRIYRFEEGLEEQDITGPWYSGGVPTEPIGFIAPLVMDPNSPTTLLAGTWRLWRTEDARGAAEWEDISDANFDPGEELTAIAVAQGAPDTIFVGTSSGRVLVTVDAETWTEAIPPPPTSTVVTDIVLRPGAPGTAYVSLQLAVGARIIRTTDYGANWENISVGLAAGPRVSALAVDWSVSPPTIIAGTGSGVYISRDDGESYLKETTLPNVNIGDLAIKGRTVFAGTYGRGTWRANLDGAGPCDPPVITKQPEPAHACIGQAVELAVEATGTALQYQWFKGEELLVGATGPVLAFDPLDAADAGEYVCRISNECGLEVTEAAEVKTDNLVSINPPDNISICEGALIIFFTFEVEGGGPISYQWRHNGQDVPGGTGATLPIFAPGPDDAGVYVCIASNECGTLISQPASLAVLTAPRILSTQPSVCILPPFSSVQLSVEATGAEPLQYQWLRNGEAIPGATLDTYLVPTLTPGDLYSVVVTNECGSDTADFALAVGCAADLNGDGVVDFVDYLEFLNYYDALDPRADINCDGVIDFGDYLEFLNHFDAGC